MVRLPTVKRLAQIASYMQMCMQKGWRDMRYRRPYIVFPRKLHSGKVIFYYQTYDDRDQRTAPRSTGQTTKTAALAFVARLHKEGVLNPPHDPLFQDWAAEWWVWDRCSYLKAKLAHGGHVSRGYADVRRWVLQKHVVPNLGNMRLSKIGPAEIEQLLLSKLDEGLSPQSVNHLRTMLATMFGEAVRLGQLQQNPVTATRRILDAPKRREAFTQQEAAALLDDRRIPELWKGDIVAYTASLLAATGGLRLGEIMALRPENLRGEWISVESSWDEKYGLKSTKTGKSRIVPLSIKAAEYLASLTMRPFLFGGERPLSKIHFRQVLYRAMERIGISEDDRRRRNLCFHSWRHLYNTALRGRIPDAKLRALTGHQTEEMTERYTHFRPEDFTDVHETLEIVFGRN
jgi:integrase